MDPSSKSVPLQKGLTVPDESGRVRLLASHCPDCSRYFFPTRKFCGVCCRDDMTVVQLSQIGRLHAWSSILRKSQHAIIDPPFVQAEVMMPEGVRVFSVLDGCEEKDIVIGMPVEVYVGDVGTLPDGQLVSAFKFRPIGAKAGASAKGGAA